MKFGCPSCKKRYDIPNDFSPTPYKDFISPENIFLKIQNTYFQNTNKYQKDPDMKIDILQAVKYLSITHF